MSATIADIHPKTLEGAAHQFADAFGSLAVQNTYLKVALGLALLVILGLVGLLHRMHTQLAEVKPVIVRVDELGRHDTIDYNVATAKAPQTDVFRRDLTAFVVKHFSRLRGALRRDFPDSLYFLEPRLANERTMSERKSIDTLMTTQGAEEIDVDVKGVKLSELNTLPYKAQVDFEQKYYQSGSRQERKKPELFTAHLDFVVRDSVPASFIQVNPLGLQITDLRIERQAIEVAP